MPCRQGLIEDLGHLAWVFFFAQNDLEELPKMRKTLAVLCAATLLSLLSLAPLAVGCSDEDQKMIQFPPVKITVSPSPVKLPGGGQVQILPVEITLPKQELAPDPTPEAP